MIHEYPVFSESRYDLGTQAPPSPELQVFSNPSQARGEFHFGSSYMHLSLAGWQFGERPPSRTESDPTGQPNTVGEGASTYQSVCQAIHVSM